MIGPVTGGETFWRRVTDLVIHTRVRRVWEQGDHLKNVAESVGLDYAAMESAIAEDAAAYDAAIGANQQSLAAAGHWGVPTIVYNGEPFFGHDRVETLLWRIAQTE